MDPDLSPVPDGEASPRGNMNDMDVNSEPCDLHALQQQQQQQQHHGVQVHGGAACAAAAQEGACASYVQTGLTCVASGGAGVCFPAMSSSHVNIPPPCPYSVNYEIPPPKADFSAPPPYEVATKLPTYDEVQREKSREGELGLPSPMHPQVPGPRPSALPMFLAIDADSHPDDSNNAMLGTDFMFFTAFVVSFLFNWIGFLLLMCFCHTIAARYGALSGFGLSLSKWTLIVKHSTDITDHVWLWWLIMSFGLLICIRAIIQYLNIKRGWRLLSGNPHAQERLLFFY